jgi:hypothetical protein
MILPAPTHPVYPTLDLDHVEACFDPANRALLSTVDETVEAQRDLIVASGGSWASVQAFAVQGDRLVLLEISQDAVEVLWNFGPL